MSTASRAYQSSSVLRKPVAPRSALLTALERYSLYAAVFLAPFITLRASDLFFTLSDLLFCICFFILLITARIPSAPIGNLTSLWLLAFLVLATGLLLSSLFEGDPLRGFIVLAQYFFAYVMLLFVVLRGDAGLAQRLATIVIASILTIDLHGIYSFYVVGYVPDSKVVSGARRLGTLLGQPNGAAAVNALIVPVVMYLWLSGRIKIWFALPALATILATVILTSSNSGLMMLLGALFVFVGWAMNYRLVSRILLLAMLAVVAYFAGGSELLPETFQKRVMEALSSGEIDQAGTYVDRLRLIHEAIQIIVDQGIVVIGLGADQFRTISVQGAPVHNLFLLLWAEGGVLALLGWTMFIAIGAKLAYDVRKRIGDVYLSAMLLSALTVFTIFAAVTAHLYARFFLVPLLVFMGLAAAALQKRPGPDAR